MKASRENFRISMYQNKCQGMSKPWVETPLQNIENHKTTRNTNRVLEIGPV